MGKYGRIELMKQESGQDGFKENGPVALLMAAVWRVLLLSPRKYRWWNGDQRPRFPGWWFLSGCR